MDSDVVLSPAELTIRIRRWKVREGFQVSKNHIILLYVDANNDGDSELKRLKVTQTGIVKKRLFKDGDMVPPG